MDPLTLAAIGAAIGAGKSYFVDAPREKRDREIAATTQRYSPWTGMNAGPIKQADMFGSTLQGGMAGAQLGQGLEQSAAYKDALAKQTAAAANSGLSTAAMPAVDPFATPYYSAPGQAQPWMYVKPH